MTPGPVVPPLVTSSVPESHPVVPSSEGSLTDPGPEPRRETSTHPTSHLPVGRSGVGVEGSETSVSDPVEVVTVSVEPDNKSPGIGREVGVETDPYTL